jgi:hypothetical protein
MKSKDKKYTSNFILFCIVLLVLQFILLNLKWLNILDIAWYYVLSPIILLFIIFLLWGFYIVGVIVVIHLMLKQWGKIEAEINKKLEEGSNESS